MFLLPAQTKTQDEISDLMYQWRRDPIFDAYEVDGFENYRGLLSMLQHEQLTEWRQRNERVDNAEAAELGCSVALVQYIARLEARISELESELASREIDEQMAFNVKLYSR